MFTAEHEQSMLAISADFCDAISRGDGDKLRRLYAADATVWHTFDRISQAPDENVRTLIWLHRHVVRLRYEEIRVAVTADGFVQQHVQRADRPEIEVPAMLRAWCADGKIHRIEEYLDSHDARPLLNFVADELARRQDTLKPKPH